MSEKKGSTFFRWFTQSRFAHASVKSEIPQQTEEIPVNTPVEKPIDPRNVRFRGHEQKPESKLLTPENHQLCLTFFAQARSHADSNLAAMLGVTSKDYLLLHEGINAASVIEAVSRAIEGTDLKPRILKITTRYVTSQVSEVSRLLSRRLKLSSSVGIDEAQLLDKILIRSDDTHNKYPISMLSHLDESIVRFDESAAHLQQPPQLFMAALNIFVREFVTGNIFLDENFDKLDSSEKTFVVAQALQRMWERALWHGSVDENVARQIAHLLDNMGVDCDEYIDRYASLACMTVFKADLLHNADEVVQQTPIKTEFYHMMRSIARHAFFIAVERQLFKGNQDLVKNTVIEAVEYFFANGGFRADDAETAHLMRDKIKIIEQHITNVMVGNAKALIELAEHCADQTPQGEPLRLAGMIKQYRTDQYQDVSQRMAEGLANQILSRNGQRQLLSFPALESLKQ